MKLGVTQLQNIFAYYERAGSKMRFIVNENDAVIWMVEKQSLSVIVY